MKAKTSNTTKGSAEQTEILDQLSREHEAVIRQRERTREVTLSRARVAAKARAAGCTWPMIGERMSVTGEGATKIARAAEHTSKDG